MLHFTLQNIARINCSFQDDNVFFFCVQVEMVGAKIIKNKINKDEKNKQLKIKLKMSNDWAYKLK